MERRTARGLLGPLVSLLRFPRVGVAALTGLTLYFVGAVIAHLRVGDGLSDIAIPLGYTVVMGTTATFRSATIETNA